MNTLEKKPDQQSDRQPGKHSLEQEVMQAIRSGRIKMRPRWKFILASTLAALGGVILLLTLLYIVSFGIFMLRQSGALFTPVFGMRGVFVFFAAIPGVLLILLLAFLVILEILVRRYSFGYRRPLVVSSLAILAIVLIGGYALERTRVHMELFREAHAGMLPPPIDQMYREPMGIHDVYHGIIVDVVSGGFVIADENSVGTTTVLIDKHTRLPLGADFEVGQEVVVFGEEASGTVHALGIRTVTE